MAARLDSDTSFRAHSAAGRMYRPRPALCITAAATTSRAGVRLYGKVQLSRRLRRHVEQNRRPAIYHQYDDWTVTFAPIAPIFVTARIVPLEPERWRPSAGDGSRPA